MSAISAAQAADCRSIASSTDRLACYDKAAPPALSKPRADQQPPAGDVLAAENSKLDARIKGICRGC